MNYLMEFFKNSLSMYMLQIFGEKGDTGVLQLKTSDSTSNKFERGRLDKFPLQATDIGKVRYQY